MPLRLRQSQSGPFVHLLKVALTLPILPVFGLQDAGPSTAPPDGEMDWGYWGPGAPNNWGSLSDEFALCSTGQRQSPVDIRDYAENPNAPALAFSYSHDALEVNHNGKIAHVEYGEGNLMTVGESHYRLASMHIHVHAEHQIDGQLFPAEMHLVHLREDGSLGVIGQIYRLGSPDPVIQALIDAYPEPGQSLRSGFSLNAAHFIPSDLGYYSYDGSLTTPPCSEGLSWYVLREIKTVSQEQVNRIAALHNGFNHRPIQARNGRTVVSTGPRPSI